MSRQPFALALRITTLAGSVAIAAGALLLGGCSSCSHSEDAGSTPSPSAHSAATSLPHNAPVAATKPADPDARARAATLVKKLGRDHFLIGMGNDLANDHDQDGAYTLGPKLDLHYAYLVGLTGKNGWPDWSPNGTFVNLLSDSADKHGVVPMFTLYSMAAEGEGNAAALTNDAYMKAYWQGARLLFERLGAFGKPAIVHFEPDFWAFTQQQAADPSTLAVQVKAHAPDCAAQPDTMVGMGHCLVALARKYAPKTLVGFHASPWASSDPESITKYLLDIGAGDADLMVIETLDRDAGCFESGTDPNCTRQDGPWYWDETNEKSPNFREHLAWAKAISDGVKKPLLWWQMPFGAPSDTPGGTPGKYRDNRVKYLFSHVDEFVQAGGIGAAFGVGAGNQTYVSTDGGQFKNAVTKYFENPTKF